MKDLSDYSLKGHNTFGIEARCTRFLEYSSEEEACRVASILRQGDTPYLIIGGGSNLLLTRDFEGVVIHSACKGIEQRGSHLVCGSGEKWDDIVSESISRGLYGAENLSLIPGEVGASAVQNIGAYGVEVKDLVWSVRAVEIATGNICVMENAECCYSYRMSRFKTDWKNQYLIVSVEYAFSEAFEPRLDYGNIRAELERQGIAEPTVQQLRSTIIGIREAKLPDPKMEGNAGSFFMNPIVGREKYEELARQYEGMPHYDIDDAHVKIPAGWMIDQCGWKGKSLGRAGVHSKQALVLVNRGGATGDEIVALCRRIQQDVSQRFGIDILPEVNMI